MASSEAQYERIPSTLEDGARRHLRGSDSIVQKFSKHAFRLAAAFIGFCFLFAIFPLSAHLGVAPWLSRRGLTPSQQADKTMDEARCSSEFPALYPQLQQNVKAWKQRGGITKQLVDQAQSSVAPGWGFARVVVKNGQIFIREVKEGQESRMSALLHVLHTAVTSDPSWSSATGMDPIDLVISPADKDGSSSTVSWVIDKRVDEDPDVGRWLFPDFGVAGWPEAGISSFEEFHRLIQREERDYPWKIKDDHAFWRGMANWYPVRLDLLAKTSTETDPSRKEWADVHETSFHDVGKQFVPIVPMHEHCRRKYLIQSEGNSYSGRFKYLLSCHAVTISHPLEWTQHFHPALNPNSTSREQNFVQLPGPLFEGLEEEVKRLQKLDSGGGGPGNSPLRIADNAQRTLRQRYLTPAATMCYTRSALRAYASVLDAASWGQDPVDQVVGPYPLEGGGVVPSGGKGKDLAKLGAQGDIEYGVWRLSGSIDWPPKSQ